MELFKKIKRRRTEKRFKRDDLNIIQYINDDEFHGIIQVLAKRGWEVSFEYQGPSGWKQSGKGQCKVRKGTSILSFSWSKEELGSVTGFKRIVSGIAKEFNLTLREQPSYCGPPTVQDS